MHPWKDLLLEIKDRKAKGQKYLESNKPSRSVSNKRQPGWVKQRKMYFLAGHLMGYYLTHREAECMLYLLRGLTIVKTAETLQLSHRTVEYYVKNMKLKIGVRTKAELMLAIIQAGFKY